jgi:hypothetical protein
MATENWGECMSCEWWQIEPDATVAEDTVGRCIEEQLQPFQLLVTGDSGCNQFGEGEPARQKGSSERPPMAEAQR